MKPMIKTAIDWASAFVNFTFEKTMAHFGLLVVDFYEAVSNGKNNKIGNK